MPESCRTRFLRWKFNWFPPYRRSGARVTYIDESLREVRIRLPLNWTTRNLNGTIYGGSISAAVDPVHAIMLVYRLGPERVVGWTKEVRTRFTRQARTELTGRFTLEETEIESVRTELAGEGKVEREFHIDLLDRDGLVCAAADILVHVHVKGSTG